MSQDFTFGEMPKEIDDLADKRVIFKIQVKPGQTREYVGSYTVMKLTSNTPIVEKYRAKFFESQVINTVFLFFQK